MTELRSTLETWTRADLLAEGFSPEVIESKLDSGEFQRLGRRWLGTGRTPAKVRRALRAGTRLTCVDALKIHGVWVLGTPDKLHVAALRGPTRHSRVKPSQFIQHRYLHAWPDDEPVVPIDVALDHAARCQSAESAAIVFESALDLHLVEMADVTAILNALPKRTRRYIGQVESSAGSGTETRVRRYFWSKGVQVRAQVEFAKDHRVDLLVGERLIIECDSKEHHTGTENYYKDRERDQTLTSKGYTVLRLTWEDVVTHWEETKELLLGLIRRGVHRSPRAQRR